MKEGEITITSDYEEVKPVRAGKTLKDAFLAAAKKHFPPSGKIPPEIFFSEPQYNTWIELQRDQNQKGIEKYADDIIKNKFPITQRSTVAVGKNTRATTNFARRHLQTRRLCSIR